MVDAVACTKRANVCCPELMAHDQRPRWDCCTTHAMHCWRITSAPCLYGGGHLQCLRREPWFRQLDHEHASAAFSVRLDIAEAFGCASDDVVLARAWSAWSATPEWQQPQWAGARFMKHGVLATLRGMREQLRGELEKLGLLQRGAPQSGPVSGALLQHVLVRAAARLQNSELCAATHESHQRHPASACTSRDELPHLWIFLEVTTLQTLRRRVDNIHGLRGVTPDPQKRRTAQSTKWPFSCQTDTAPSARRQRCWQLGQQQALATTAIRARWQRTTCHSGVPLATSASALQLHARPSRCCLWPPAW
jgi:hypothetical protein